MWSAEAESEVKLSSQSLLQFTCVDGIQRQSKMMLWLHPHQLQDDLQNEQGAFMLSILSH